MAMLARAVYVLFVVLFGWPFMLINWMLRGTRGSRQRQALVRQQQQTNALLAQQARALAPPPVYRPKPPTYWTGDLDLQTGLPANYAVRSPDGHWWWDGTTWRPVS